MAKDSPSPSKEPTEPEGGRRSGNPVMIALVIAALAALLFVNRGEERDTITASFFQQELAKKNIDTVQIGDLEVTGKFKVAPEKPFPEGKNIDEDTKPEKYRKEFVFTRPAGSEYASGLQKQLEAKDAD